ncbi:MAG: AAA family ATPase, partial [bacterium]|nr:AAA family ATPase [bacterium]
MIYRFENFELNTQLYTLTRAGETTRLRPKVFQVLLYLLEHRDQVVSKQELAEQVWPDQFISNSTLESAIRLLRQALGDSGRAQRIIQTSHGYGYRFATQVTEPAGVAEPDVYTQEKEVWRCLTCQHVNTADPAVGGAFCIECGAPFRSRCLHCDAENLPQAHFCAACGTSLDDQQPVSPQDQPLPGTQVSTERDGREAERRQLTVMVCDLVDAVTLPERLELEDLHDVIRAYQETCADVVRRFDGHIAQTSGSGVLVYFGYPQAHEDDAQRAVHAGLGIVEALQALNARLTREKSIKLAVRLGIHTGLVVIGGLGGDNRHDALALGDTPNTASQIQGIAAPDAVMISAATAHLVEGYFALRDLDMHTLEGTVAPVQIYQVLGLSDAQSRLDIVSSSGLTPFVGREAEISLLLERWSQVKEGMGQAVLLSGEPGVGKSRLVQVLKERIAEDDYLQLECRCSPYYQHSALYPVIDLFNRVLQWQRGDPHDEKFEKLETVLTQYDLPLNEIIPLFAPLLGLPAPDDRYPSLYLAPQQQRQKTLEAIVAFLLAMASRQPVLLIIEDLHWLDPSTLELLTLLMDQTPTTSICSLFTYRLTFQVPWGNRSYLTQITLPRLSRHQVEQMVTCITGGKPLTPEVLQHVVNQTDGVPLFVEELTKT